MMKLNICLFYTKWRNEKLVEEGFDSETVYNQNI